MTRVNMLEAKSNLSKLVKLLETGQEDVIYIARNGKAVAQLVLVPKRDVSARIGIAEGEINLPDDFDEEFDKMDSDIIEMFEDSGLI